MEIARHATAHVVRRRHDGDGCSSHVDTVAFTSLVDGGETVPKKALGLVGDVEHDVLRTTALHLVVDGPGDHITRSEVLHGVVLFHEGSTIRKAQDSTLTSQGFADQKALGARLEEDGGMKLEKLHVRDFRPGTK